MYRRTFSRANAHRASFCIPRTRPVHDNRSQESAATLIYHVMMRKSVETILNGDVFHFEARGALRSRRSTVVELNSLAFKVAY